MKKYYQWQVIFIDNEDMDENSAYLFPDVSLAKQEAVAYLDELEESKITKEWNDQSYPHRAGSVVSSVVEDSFEVKIYCLEYYDAEVSRYRTKGLIANIFMEDMPEGHLIYLGEGTGICQHGHYVNHEGLLHGPFENTSLASDFYRRKFKTND